MTDLLADLLDGLAEDGDDSLTGRVLLAAAVVGPNLYRIHRALRALDSTVTQRQVREVTRRARATGVFVGGKVAASDGWNDSVGFHLDCLVVDGMLERA
jgi:hypothetical protein